VGRALANAEMLCNWVSEVSYNSSIMGLLQIRDISHLSNMLPLENSAAWRRELFNSIRYTSRHLQYGRPYNFLFPDLVVAVNPNKT
jgi:hypothetical protein